MSASSFLNFGVYERQMPLTCARYWVKFCRGRGSAGCGDQGDNGGEQDGTLHAHLIGPSTGVL
jgi:hypothetical protein